LEKGRGSEPILVTLSRGIAWPAVVVVIGREEPPPLPQPAIMKETAKNAAGADLVTQAASLLHDWGSVRAGD
jgi:hypothetical protein